MQLRRVLRIFEDALRDASQFQLMSTQNAVADVKLTRTDLLLRACVGVRETPGLGEVAGRILANPIVSGRDQPETITISLASLFGDQGGPRFKELRDDHGELMRYLSTLIAALRPRAPVA
jgi:hypothetical protein